MKHLRKRLTYANVMSSIAVFLVLGGGAAIAAGLAKNSVGSKQLKKNAVTAAKIKKNAVTAAKIQNGAITGAKVNLGSLGTVPSADKANTANSATSAGSAGAVNGQTVVKIFTLIPNGSTNQTIASFAGFTIRADCTGSNVENLELDPPNTDSDLKAFGDGQSSGPFFEANQGSEPNEISLNSGNDRGETTFSAATRSGTVVSGSLGYDDPNSFANTEACAFFGQVLVTA